MHVIDAITYSEKLCTFVFSSGVQHAFVFSENVFPIIYFLLIISTSSLTIAFKICH